MDNHLIAAVRQNHPITFTVANTVTSGKVADALSAIGASPIMSTALEEAADLVAAAHAVTLNIGTPTAELCKELTAVAAAANRLHKPLVLDPVACGATAFRQQINHDLLTSHQFTVIRGNAGEIASLAGVDWDGHGIDAGSGDGDLVTLAERCASRYQTTVVLSGPVDVITNGQATRHNDRGTEWLHQRWFWRYPFQYHRRPPRPGSRSHDRRLARLSARNNCRKERHQGHPRAWQLARTLP